jgi:hypothetical protein
MEGNEGTLMKTITITQTESNPDEYFVEFVHDHSVKHSASYTDKWEMFAACLEWLR